MQEFEFETFLLVGESRILFVTLNIKVQLPSQRRQIFASRSAGKFLLKMPNPKFANLQDEG